MAKQIIIDCDPGLFDGPMANVAIETGDGLTRGATVVDVLGFSDWPKNARWINLVDTDGVFRVMTTAIAKLA